MPAGAFKASKERDTKQITMMSQTGIIFGFLAQSATGATHCMEGAVQLRLTKMFERNIGEKFAGSH